jgi:hypothetical protein
MPTLYENEKDGGSKNEYSGRIWGLRGVGKKVVGTFDLSVPEKNKDNKNVAWIWVNRIQTHYFLFWVCCGFLIRTIILVQQASSLCSL